jgi:hypothetical protein
VPSAELQDALAAARERGRLRAADILSSEDMLSAEDFAKLLGTTRVTVNTKRQSGQILGLDGAKRGGVVFRRGSSISTGKPSLNFQSCTICSVEPGRSIAFWSNPR